MKKECFCLFDKNLRDTSIYFKTREGVSVSFKETSREIDVIFPRYNDKLLISYFIYKKKSN